MSLRFPFVLTIGLLLFRPPQAERTFESNFTSATMRVDYFHTGGPTAGETIALDRVVNDGEWPGSRTQLIDATNLGKYRFEVRSTRTTDVIYSRGFASIYGEWETTGEQKTAHRTFHESLRFPWPREPVTVTLSKRQPDNSFATIWTTEIYTLSLHDALPISKCAARARRT